MTRIARLPMMLLIAFAPATFATANDDASGKIQGTWKILKYVNDGEDETPETKDEMLTVKGNHYELKTKDGEYRGDLKLDDSAKPATIDATLFDTEDKKLGEAIGIYKMDGDDLMICWSEETKERPSTFASPSGSKLRLIVLKKTK